MSALLHFQHLRLRKARHRSRGAALILALLLTALGAAVAAQLIQPLAGWLSREYRARDLNAAYTLADAAATWSLTVLSGDARTSTIDHKGELWAIPLPRTQIEGGSIQGQISDLQAKFNLNHVAPNGLRNDVALAVARNLFTRAGVPLALADRLADALDADDLAISGGSEAQTYGAPLPNRKLENLGELLSLGGFTQAHLDQLAPWVDVLPDSGGININTASADLLKAALPGISDAQWAKMLAVRDAKPFANVAEASLALGAPIPDTVFSVSTQFFEMNALISFDLVNHSIAIRAQRKPGLAAQIYYRNMRNA